MSGFWHAALKTTGSGAVAAFVFLQCYSAILNAEVLGGILQWQRFALLALIALLVFIFCFYLIGYGLKLVTRSDVAGARTIIVEKSHVGGDVVGGDKVSYKDRP